MVREIFGKVRKSEISETVTGRHGIITFTVYGGELMTLRYGNESKCEIPPDGSWILASIEGEDTPHLIDFEIRREPSGRRLKDMKLPSSIPDPVREYNVPVILSMVLLIVFGTGTFIISFTALVWPTSTISMWGVFGVLTVLLSPSLLYKEPEQIFDEESGTARYGYATIFEWFFTIGSTTYWILILSSPTNFGIGIEVIISFLTGGLLCVFLVMYRVVVVYSPWISNQLKDE